MKEKTDGFKYYKHDDFIYKVDAKTLETWAYHQHSTRWIEEDECWGENKHDKHATELTQEEAFLEIL